jgi:hypothetical protein
LVTFGGKKWRERKNDVDEKIKRKKDSKFRGGCYSWDTKLKRVWEG